MEFDPATGRLTFAKQGASNAVLQTGIRSSTTGPIHFFAAVYGGGSASIAEQ